MIRTLFRVVRHTAVAYLAAGLLGVAGAMALNPANLFGASADARAYALELRLAPGPLPDGRTAPLLSDVTREVTPEAGIRIRQDGTWLVVFAATTAERGDLNRAVRPVLDRHGFAITTVRLTSAWSELVAAIVEAPLSEAVRYASLVPMLIAFGGAGFIVTAWYFRRRYPAGDWESAAVTGSRAVGIGVGVGLCSLAMVTGLSVGLSRLGAPVEEQAWVDAIVAGGGAAFALLFALATIVAPVGEELLFRGHLFRHLAAHGFRIPAYLFSSVVFAAAHGNNPTALPVYLVYGLVLAWSFERWRSILVPIAAHATVNAVSLGLAAWA